MDEKSNLLARFKALSEDYDLYIVGAGKFGAILGKWLNQKQVNWKGYLDRLKSGEVLNDKKIFNTFGVKGKNDYYIISSVIHRNEIKEDLIGQGVSDNRIFSFESDGLLYDIYEETDGWKEYTERIRKFKDCHKNEKRCFIIGNGPSLKIEDLEKLRNDVTFACNSIYAVYDSTDWRPNYYVASDTIFCERMLANKEDVKKITSGCEAAFVSAVGKGFKFRENNEMQMIYFIRSSLKIDENTQLPYFSGNCSDIVYISGTVTYEMLQLAVYMGFNPIYLLGIDFTFSYERHKDGTINQNNIVNHMEQIEKEEETFQKAIEARYGYSYIADIDLQKDGYIAAKKYADEHGIKIYNATRGGKLEVFERVDFDSLF